MAGIATQPVKAWSLASPQATNIIMVKAVTMTPAVTAVGRAQLAITRTTIITGTGSGMSGGLTAATTHNTHANNNANMPASANTSVSMIVSTGAAGKFNDH